MLDMLQAYKVTSKISNLNNIAIIFQNFSMIKEFMFDAYTLIRLYCEVCMEELQLKFFLFNFQISIFYNKEKI